MPASRPKKMSLPSDPQRQQRLDDWLKTLWTKFPGEEKEIESPEEVGVACQIYILTHVTEDGEVGKQSLLDLILVENPDLWQEIKKRPKLYDIAWLTIHRLCQGS